MRRYNKRYLYYNFLISIFVSLFAVFFICSQTFFTDDPIEFNIDGKSILIFMGIYIVIEVFTIIYLILQYKYIAYEIKDDLIKLKKGIIFKKEINLKYERMHAIDLKQNIIQKIFKITKLSIDSGSTTKADRAEVVIVEDDEVIKAIQAKVLSKIKGEKLQVEAKEKEVVLYRYENIDKLMFVFMASLTTFIITFLCFILGSVYLFIFINETAIIDIILFSAIAIIVGGLIFTSVTTFLFVLLRYYNYKVIVQKDSFNITHGLITKVNHVLYFNKIKAIKIEEGLIKRMFKYASIKLEVVGFGEVYTNDNNNTKTYNYLIPLCKKEHVKSLISNLNLEFKFVEKSHESPKRAFRYFINLPMFLFSVIYFLFLPFVLKTPYNFTFFLTIYLSVYFLILTIIFLNGFLHYKNSGIYYDDLQTVIYYGSFTKVSLLVLNKNITEIEIIDTYCRSQNDIASYNIHYFNNAYKNEAKAHLLEKKLADEIRSKVRY